MQRVIDLNGTRYDVPTEVETLQNLLDHLNLTERIAVVELNRDIVAKDAYDQPIKDRDQIEIVHFVGGG